MILTFTGNPCIDKTIYVDTFEPGKKNHGHRVSAVAGGKGCNVSKAVQRLGVQTHAALIVGGNSGQDILGLLENKHKINTIPLWVHSHTRTITTVLEESIHRQTPIFEPGSRITLKEYETTKQTFINLVDELKLVTDWQNFFVTFNGSVCDPSASKLYADLIPKIKKRKVKVILDSHGKEFLQALETAPFMIKPNLEEAEQALGFKINNKETQKKAFEQFHNFGVKLVAISQGKEGALVSYKDYEKQEQFKVIPPTIEEVNHVGCGDCFLAGVAVGLYQNIEIKEALRLGTAAGTANAATWEIGEFSMDQLEEFKEEVQIIEL